VEHVAESARRAGGFEKGEHGYDPAVVLALLDQAEFLKDPADVLLDSVVTHVKGLGDGVVVPPGRHLLEHERLGRAPPDERDHGVLTYRRPDDRPEDDENFVFVSNGIEAAVAKAKELAGDKNVVVNGGQMARQALEAGLLDEIGIELVPVVLGAGTPLFPELSATPVQFEGPIAVVEGTGVTHLRYRVKK
jgi:RibD C-terminal domain